MRPRRRWRRLRRHAQRTSTSRGLDPDRPRLADRAGVRADDLGGPPDARHRVVGGCERRADRGRRRCATRCPCISSTSCTRTWTSPPTSRSASRTTSTGWPRRSPARCGSRPPTPSRGCSTRRACSSSGSTRARARSRSSSTCSRTRPGSGSRTGNGVVTLDLGELVRSLGAELGISSATLDRIPPDAGELEIMRSDQLEAAQAGVKSVRRAEHLAAGARARPLRTGDRPRPRRPAGDAPQRRLRARPGRACGARRATPGRQLRGGRPDRAELARPAAAASGSSARRSSRRSAGPP